MTQLTITEVDPSDDDAFAEFHAAYWRAERDGLGDVAIVWTLPELQVMLHEPNRRLWQAAYVAHREGVAVGTGWVATPLMDNLETARVALNILPEHRRRGYGTEILAHLEQVARERGRTRLDGEVSWPQDLGASGAGWPGVQLATARGYQLTLGDVQRELLVPVDDDLLDQLAADAAPHHTAYRLSSWVGDVPEDIALSWMTLSSSLMTEAPTGEKEIEPEVVDVDALREGEAIIAKQGRTRYNTVALNADGEVVAYTDMVATPHEPGRVYQWGTLVRRPDRGHRLGTAVKVANQQLLQRERDDIVRITTFNAEVNTHMIDVNERMGFRPVARLGEFQKRLS